VVCELATMHEGLVPDVSLGTHFFNDLVETNMLYMALYPEREGNLFNEPVLKRFPNRLTAILPDASLWKEAVYVIDTPDPDANLTLYLNVDAMKQRAVCFAGK
jgi:hypothetical protein